MSANIWSDIHISIKYDLDGNDAEMLSSTAYWQWNSLQFVTEGLIRFQSERESGVVTIGVNYRILYVFFLNLADYLSAHFFGKEQLEFINEHFYFYTVAMEMNGGFLFYFFFDFSRSHLHTATTPKQLELNSEAKQDKMKRNILWRWFFVTVSDLI